jgi:hypothetical protein
MKQNNENYNKRLRFGAANPPETDFFSARHKKWCPPPQDDYKQINDLTGDCFAKFNILFSNAYALSQKGIYEKYITEDEARIDDPRFEKLIKHSFGIFVDINFYVKCAEILYGACRKIADEMKAKRETKIVFRVDYGRRRGNGIIECSSDDVPNVGKILFDFCVKLRDIIAKAPPRVRVQTPGLHVVFDLPNESEEVFHAPRIAADAVDDIEEAGDEVISGAESGESPEPRADTSENEMSGQPRTGARKKIAVGDPTTKTRKSSAKEAETPKTRAANSEQHSGSIAKKVFGVILLAAAIAVAIASVVFQIWWLFGPAVISLIGGSFSLNSSAQACQKN